MDDFPSDATLARLVAETTRAIEGAADLRALDALRVAVLGKSGSLTAMLKALGGLEPERRRAEGAALNAARDAIGGAIEARRAAIAREALATRLASERVDVTLPPPPPPPGTLHPVSRTVDEMVAIFGAMGFTVADGPDIETDWHNFGALNIPSHHPARADHDTFYLPALGGAAANEPPRVLRTHTSPVQVRTMLSGTPPIRVICPGRVYRADHDATHAPMFHQCEGLVIDRGITLGHLKGCLVDFLRAFFALPDLRTRFRASYFPFTEPSMEVDIGWDRLSGQLGAGTDWLEVLGSGMVNPKVLANCGLDPTEWQGFAFGMGIDRMAMLKNAIPDLRPMFESDPRWLRQNGWNPLAPASLHEGI